MSPHAMAAARNGEAHLGKALAACLAFTFLNPHVYLDTVVLLGGLSAQYSGPARLAYGLGAAVASFIWFFALGYGARLLTPLFSKPQAWHVLDMIIAGVMAALGVSLVLRLL
jgi:L-lysine exporter family protein LysE/ArgO